MRPYPLILILALSIAIVSCRSKSRSTPPTETVAVPEITETGAGGTGTSAAESGLGIERPKLLRRYMKYGFAFTHDSLYPVETYVGYADSAGRTRIRIFGPRENVGHAEFEMETTNTEGGLLLAFLRMTSFVRPFDESAVEWIETFLTSEKRHFPYEAKKFGSKRMLFHYTIASRNNVTFAIEVWPA